MDALKMEALCASYKDSYGKKTLFFEAPKYILLDLQCNNKMAN